MHEVNIKNIDLNLLVILFELLKTKQITQASINLGMSQSATSRAFGRLKTTFDDPLLIRTTKGYELSHRAESILPKLQTIISNINSIVDKPHFDPSEAKGVIKFFGVDLEIISYLPALFSKIQKEAPGIQLSVLTGTQDHFSLLKSGEVHFSMTAMNLNTDQNSLKRTILSEEKSVCVARKGHPLAGLKLTLKRYLSCKHGLINLTGTGLSSIDRVLSKMGKSRDVVIRLPSFTTAAYFCEQSDVIFMMPENIANEVVKRHNLITFTPPKEINNALSQFFLYWHESNHNNLLCEWVRKNLMKER